MPQLICPRRVSFLVALGFVSIASLGLAQQVVESDPPSDSIADSTPLAPASDANSDSETETSAPLASDSAPSFLDGGVPETIEELRMMETKFAELTDLVKPATVNIQLGASQGSGVVVTSGGYILTAAHVIGRPGGKATVVFPDGKEFTATTLGVDSSIDSGMLKIDDGQADDYPYLAMGLSDELTAGQWVMAIGHPGGLDEKRGLVVRVGRILFESRRVLRTDCTLVGGDSGGPLVDMNGEVIGIHSRIGSQLWNNLHVPIDTYSANWDQMAAGIAIDGRPNLGFSVVDATNEIKSVVAKGPADKAGIKKGDLIKNIVIKNFLNKKINDGNDIRAIFTQIKPGMKMQITIERHDEEQTLELVVGQQ